MSPTWKRLARLKLVELAQIAPSLPRSDSVLLSVLAIALSGNGAEDGDQPIPMQKLLMMGEVLRHKACQAQASSDRVVAAEMMALAKEVQEFVDRDAARH
jgi:hypothetical protein